MEHKLKQIVPDILRFEELLGHFMIIYHQEPETFYKIYKKSDKVLTKAIKYLSTIKEDIPEEYVDVVECAGEVYYYFTSYKEKLKKKKEEEVAGFTLRNSDDLITFEFFLDKMERLYNASPKHFLDLFPKCPIVFWDKIDDLRETSYKDERDSEEYTRCLFKCKTLSFKFSELSGSNI